MFDWDDQEIANIIWGEADDHIVPYPEGNENKPLQCADPDNDELTGEATNSKPSEQKTSASTNNVDGGKSENSKGLSSLSTSKTDLNCIAKKSDLGKGPKVSEDLQDDGELVEIVGNTWADIGSFDDLDQILSNNELVGPSNHDTGNELWSSSRDVISGTAKPSSLALEQTSWGLEGLDNSSDDFKFDSDYLHEENDSLASGYGKEADSPLFGQDSCLFDAKSSLRSMENTLSEPQSSVRKVTSTESMNKDNWYKSSLKPGLEEEKISDRRLLEDIYGAWPPPSLHVQQFDTQSLPSTKSYPSPVIGQQNIRDQSPLYERFSNPYTPTYGYGNLQDQYNTGATVFSNAKAGLGVTGSIRKSKDTLAKPMMMTPQEKIEKLRKRQQMRAMLAIQKQQQQLTVPVSGVDYTAAQKSSVEDQIQLERTDFELEKLKTPTCDFNSPLKQDDPASISVDVDDHNAEDTVLYQLQNMVANLDMNIRLCIRDSLFRLAQSAMQRHYPNDSSGGNRSRFYEPNSAKEDMSNDRFDKMASAETETNHIDRAVAHLLFHRPWKQPAKQKETPPQSSAPKVSPELETGASTNMLPCSLVKNSVNEQSITPHGSKAPSSFMEPHQEHREERPRAEMSADQKRNQPMVMENLN